MCRNSCSFLECEEQVSKLALGMVFQIFCAKCKSQDALPDNDIILCDGFCNRGFHQNCLQPPLATEDSKNFCFLGNAVLVEVVF